MNLSKIGKAIGQGGKAAEEAEKGLDAAKVVAKELLRR